jgi:hypothetical protein
MNYDLSTINPLKIERFINHSLGFGFRFASATVSTIMIYEPVGESAIATNVSFLNNPGSGVWFVLWVS